MVLILKILKILKLGFLIDFNSTIMRKTIILVFFFTISIQAQFTNVLISKGTFHYPNEPAIKINPNNTDIQFAGSNINNYYVSLDGGATWSENTLTSYLGVWGDPALAIDSNGDFYFFHLSNADAWIDRMVCQKSTDNGVTFNEGTFFGLNGSKKQDKEWVILDRDDNLYVTWTEFDAYGSSDPTHKSRILFSKSTDGAATWTTPVKVNIVDGDCVDEDLTVEGAVPAIGPNGEVYVSWAGPSGLVFSKSTDGGATWLSDETLIDTMPGGWDFNVPGIDRTNGLPVTVCDLSGGDHNGTIYVNWSDQRNGEDDTDIWLKKSIDGGDTWSDVIRVNDDSPGKHQFLTWMDIDQTTGYLYFVFYDRRNYSDDNTDVYMAMSNDGGATFQNYLISETPFISSDSAFFGDYNNIAAHNGIVRPIWKRFDSGQSSVWTALIDPETLTTNDTVFNTNFELGQNYPNPFEEETYVSFKLRSKQKISLTIYNVLGKKVATIIDQKEYDYGKYIEKISLSENNLIPGVYFYKIQIGNEIQTKKMVIK